MSTLDHKKNFRNPTDNNGGFYISPNGLDDIVLTDGTPGLQRIIATNQASAIGPYILRGLNVVDTTLQAGEAVFKSGGIVSVVASALPTTPDPSGNFIYLDNAGNLTRESSVTYSDTKLLIDYYYNGAWVCTKEDAAQACLGHKKVDVVDGKIVFKDTTGTGKETTIDTATGIVTDAATITAGTVTTLNSTTSTLGAASATTMSVSTTPSASTDVVRLGDLETPRRFIVSPVLLGYARNLPAGSYTYSVVWTYESAAYGQYQTFNGVNTPDVKVISASYSFVIPDDATTGTVTVTKLGTLTTGFWYKYKIGDALVVAADPFSGDVWTIPSVAPNTVINLSAYRSGDTSTTYYACNLLVQYTVA